MASLPGIFVLAGSMSMTMLSTALVAAPAPKPVACAALAKLNVPGAAFEIVKAEVVPAATAPAALPAHCRVEGVMDKRTGVDGKAYAIRFAIAMPDNWNGRFLFQGGGGMNGALLPPVGAAAAGDTSALARGFAVASTDSGHASAVFDASFLKDQEAAINFLYQANAKVTVVAKQIVAAHYGKAQEHSYYVGCSMGGREGMTMSQRYPDYFDGIVVGDPMMRTSYSNLAMRWVATSLNSVAPKDANGKLQTAKALSPSDRKLFTDALLQSCDALDGARDGLIFATQKCNFDPQVLACTGEKTDACLSTQQIAAVKKALAGPRTSGGQQVYPGYLYDTGLNSSGRGLPGALVTGLIPEGPPVTGASMDVDAEAAVAHDARSMLGDTNAWTNLSSFSAHGGKIIFYHGASDPWSSALDTQQYYEHLTRDNPAPVSSWSRFFLVPGMGHCGGGEATLDKFDMVEPIVNWVEKGQAPDRVIATGASMPGQSRPLCPFPKHAQYVSGDEKSAASYQCTE
jgi:pimeloyl-ACP methyl ester carboxylesterase